MKKRALSLFLAFIMTLCLTVPAFAAPEAPAGLEELEEFADESEPVDEPMAAAIDGVIKMGEIYFVTKSDALTQLIATVDDEKTIMNILVWFNGTVPINVTKGAFIFVVAPGYVLTADFTVGEGAKVALVSGTFSYTNKLGDIFLIADGVQFKKSLVGQYSEGFEVNNGTIYTYYEKKPEATELEIGDTVTDLMTETVDKIYSVTASDKNITVNPTQAYEGTTITVTPTDSTYKVESVTVKKTDGTEIGTVTGSTFKMPGANVTV